MGSSPIVSIYEFGLISYVILMFLKKTKKIVNSYAFYIFRILENSLELFNNWSLKINYFFFNSLFKLKKNKKILLDNWKRFNVFLLNIYHVLTLKYFLLKIIFFFYDYIKYKDIFFLKLKKKLKRKKMRFKYIFLKKRKYKKKFKRKNVNLYNSYFLVKKQKYNRYFNNLICQEERVKSNTPDLEDHRGKYSSFSSYHWIKQYCSGDTNLLLKNNKNFFKINKYYKKNEIIENIKKKKYSLFFFDKYLFFFDIKDLLDVYSDYSFVLLKNKVYLVYIPNKLYKKKLFLFYKELNRLGISKNQLEQPYRYFKKNNKKSYINWI